MFCIPVNSGLVVVTVVGAATAPLNTTTRVIRYQVVPITFLIQRSLVLFGLAVIASNLLINANLCMEKHGTWRAIRVVCRLVCIPVIFQREPDKICASENRMTSQGADQSAMICRRVDKSRTRLRGVNKTEIWL